MELLLIVLLFGSLIVVFQFGKGFNVNITVTHEHSYPPIPQQEPEPVKDEAAEDYDTVNMDDVVKSIHEAMGVMTDGDHD